MSQGVKAYAAPSRGLGSRPRLQTKFTQDKLEKRLTKIFREERTLEEEQGISTLYLALGFLKWFDSDQTEDPSFAPLVLVPVTMIRVRDSDGYLLRGRDDDIEVNVAKLKPVRRRWTARSIVGRAVRPCLGGTAISS
jgi:hypothetical protein